VNADMPAGFQFDELNSGFGSNKREADGDAFAMALFKRWGRVGGYEAIFEHRAARVESRVDVFRKSEGARIVLAWHQRNVGSAAVSQSRLLIGDEAWLTESHLAARFGS
jgi:hypothetical protein